MDVPVSDMEPASDADLGWLLTEPCGSLSTEPVSEAREWTPSSLVQVRGGGGISPDLDASRSDAEAGILPMAFSLRREGPALLAAGALSGAAARGSGELRAASDREDFSIEKRRGFMSGAHHDSLLVVAPS